METIKKILTAILKWLGSIPSDKLLHLIAGAVIAAFSPLSFPIRLKYASYSPPSQGWQKRLSTNTATKWDWLDLAYTMAGGFIIQIFAWL